ncbi:hypothetical protein [Aeromonas caviae]|uniref:hypothetical protein n=1 Tax=Aeromonas caviae TaxID=648 RepID=UPI00385AAC91
MQPHHRNTFLKLSLMVQAVERKVLPDELNGPKGELLRKLKAELARYNALYQDDDEVYRTPSMGVVELKRETLPEPIYLFGTDIRAKEIVRLSVFSASQNARTGEVRKEGLLTEAIMSEYQFGEALMNANNGSGTPITLTYDSAVSIPAYSPENDETKKTLGLLADSLNEISDQVDGFIQDIKGIVEKAKEKGRLGASDNKEIVKYTGYVTDHSLGNSAFHLKLLSEEMSKRSSEAALGLHISANNLRIEHKEQ